MKIRTKKTAKQIGTKALKKKNEETKEGRREAKNLVHFFFLLFQQFLSIVFL